MPRWLLCHSVCDGPQWYEASHDCTSGGMLSIVWYGVQWDKNDISLSEEHVLEFSRRRLFKLRPSWLIYSVQHVIGLEYSFSFADSVSRGPRFFAQSGFLFFVAILLAHWAKPILVSSVPLRCAFICKNLETTCSQKYLVEWSMRIHRDRSSSLYRLLRLTSASEQKHAHTI